MSPTERAERVPEVIAVDEVERTLSVSRGGGMLAVAEGDKVCILDAGALAGLGGPGAVALGPGRSTSTSASRGTTSASSSSRTGSSSSGTGSSSVLPPAVPEKAGVRPLARVSAAFEVARDGAVCRCGGQQLYFRFTGLEKGGLDALVFHAFPLVGCRSEDVREDAFSCGEVFHRDAQMFDALHAPKVQHGRGGCTFASWKEMQWTGCHSI